jgi:two-component system, response regulator
MSRTLNVIVADDDPDDHHLIKEAFLSADIPVNIHQVFNGVQLLEFLRGQEKPGEAKFAPDFILLDLNMPLMFGSKVLKQMKSDSTLRQIPVYIITTSNAQSERELAMALGAAGFFQKGVSSRDIVDIVKQVCAPYLT